MGADGDWCVNETILVSFLSDSQIHSKAGGNAAVLTPNRWPQWTPGLTPFTDAKLRTATHRGGAVPWNKMYEGKPVNLYGDKSVPAVPAPASADARYVLEAPIRCAYGPTSAWFVKDPSDVLPVNAKGFTYSFVYVPGGMSGPPTVTMTFVPNAEDAALLQMSQADLKKALLRSRGAYIQPYVPSNPLITIKPQPLGRGLLLVGYDLPLVKPATAGLNAKHLGVQAPLFVEMSAGKQGYTLPSITGGYNFPRLNTLTWDGTNYVMGSIDPVVSEYYPSGNAFATVLGGWLYQIQLDPTTGVITEVNSVPECRVRQFSLNAAQAGYEYTTDLFPNGYAITWPTGLRQLTGISDYDGSGHPQGKVYWKPAPDWKQVAVCIDWHDYFNPIYGGPYLYGNVTPNTTGVPAPWYGPYSPLTGGWWRGFAYREQQRIQSFISGVAVSDGWNLLCTVPSQVIGGDYQAVIMGSTLPSPGQEIILAGGTSTELYSTNLCLIPEAAAPAVAIPDFLGGLVQGGTS